MRARFIFCISRSGAGYDNLFSWLADLGIVEWPYEAKSLGQETLKWIRRIDLA